MPEVVKAIGVSEVSYYRWRKEYGGIGSPKPSASKSSNARAPLPVARSKTRRPATTRLPGRPTRPGGRCATLETAKNRIETQHKGEQSCVLPK